MTMPLIPDRFAATQSRNHFPIAVQLGVLSLFLLLIFGGLYLAQAPAPQLSQAEPYQTQPLYAATSATSAALADINITAKAAYVWDSQAQRALYKKNEDAVLPLASITKLMTALLSHELVAHTATVNITDRALSQDGDSGLLRDEAWQTDRLQALSLIASSNDAAFALGAAAGSLLGDDDAAVQFVAGMNIRAAELGLHSLQFSNMTGLDVSATTPGAVGTARDVSFLVEHILRTAPEVLEPTHQATARLYTESGLYHDVENTNSIADRIPNLLASKTGYTDLAGGNLTVAFDLGHNHPIIITVLGSTRDQRFVDVLTLVAAVQAAHSPNQ